MAYPHQRKNTVYPQLFHSKAETLAVLSEYKDLYIPPLHYFSAVQWRTEQDAVCGSLADFALASAGTSLAVRSSCCREDSATTSGAGAFCSRLHVAPEKDSLVRAVNDVFRSYGEAAEEDLVLVQPMLQNIRLNGVIMTRVLTDGSPYYVINYDDESGATDTITGGRGASKTVYIYRDARPSDFDSDRLQSFVTLARRVEELCRLSALDIEFCQTEDGLLHVLQVRPICTQRQWIARAELFVRSNIRFITRFLRERMLPSPDLHGKTTILGVMPDWNPAEMIGVTPRPLAGSLYRELITRKTWRQARGIMGYRSLPSEELMVLLAGRPYIDVRLSFNSFLPAGLDPVTGEALVSAWLERLDRIPQLHDKIEFEIAQTCMDFCFDQQLNNHYPDLLTRARREHFRAKLRELTRNCMNPQDSGSLGRAFDSITELRNRQASQSSAASRPSPLPHLLTLLEECRTYGTLPFSILARHAFIAEALLRSAVSRGALAPQRLAAFKASIRTVAGEMSCDFAAACRGDINKDFFLEKYGHLRPSSYDILSPRYDMREDLFTGSLPADAAAGPQEFAFTPGETHDLTLLLREAGLEEAPALLEHYARRAISGRELAKFIFSRHLSDILELIALWGEKELLDRQKLSFLTVTQITEWACHALLRTPESYFGELAEQGQKIFELGRSLKLGYLIRSPRDVAVVPQHRSAPNFVGHAVVEAPVVLLHADTPCSVSLCGCIVCIENADPGFDWIFTRDIAGLITLFGGTNSHMAIRCAEYGLPAAIGVGAVLFEQISQAKTCLLNSGACVLQPL